MWISLIVVTVFFVLGILFLAGKGQGFISSMNIMNQQQKQEYDIKKITRGHGILCIIIAIINLAIFFVRYFWQNSKQYIVLILLVLTVVITVLFVFSINKSKYFKK